MPWASRRPAARCLRTDTAGSAVELFAGGLQNPYDLAFNQEGELFTCDSDMEWDSGMPWYRPTRLNHVMAGCRVRLAQRLGQVARTISPTACRRPWSWDAARRPAWKSTPITCSRSAITTRCSSAIGRGAGSWPFASKPHGATYKAVAEVFVEGQPLNVTDIAVAPDGWLYFCTGGRDTEGGIYRVVWDGWFRPTVTKRGKGIAAALDQPQLTSAWARQQVSLVKQQLGEKLGHRTDRRRRGRSQHGRPPHTGTRADAVFGPLRPNCMLVEISHDRDAALRAQGGLPDGIACRPRHRRGGWPSCWTTTTSACSGSPPKRWFARDQPISPDALLTPVGLPRPARGLGRAASLASNPPRRMGGDRPAQLRCPGVRPRLRGPAHRGRSAQAGPIDGVLDAARRLVKEYLSDDDFLGLLRVVELALIKGQVKGDEVVALRTAAVGRIPFARLSHESRAGAAVGLPARSVLCRAVGRTTWRPTCRTSRKCSC